MNTPNKYRVLTVAGMNERVFTVENLAALDGMRNIVSVTPVYVEEYPPLTEEEIHAAIETEQRKTERANKEEYIKELEHALTEARAYLKRIGRIGQ